MYELFQDHEGYEAMQEAHLPPLSLQTPADTERVFPLSQRPFLIPHGS